MIVLWRFVVSAANWLILITNPLRLTHAPASLRLRPIPDQARPWFAHALNDRCVGSVRCHGDLGRPAVPALVG